MTLRLNPFAIAAHNQWRLPRVVFHLTHVAMGVPFWALHHFGIVPLWVALLLGAVLAMYSKRTWLDWHRTSGRFFHAWVPYTMNWPDFVSDLGLSLLGVWLPAWPRFVGLLYVLSTFNDP